MAKAYFEVDYLAGDEPRTARTSVGSCTGLGDDLVLEHNRYEIRTLVDDLAELSGRPARRGFVDVFTFSGDMISKGEFDRLQPIIESAQVVGSYCDC